MHTPAHKWTQLPLPLEPDAGLNNDDFALDDTPLVCPLRKPDETCEGCQ